MRLRTHQDEREPLGPLERQTSMRPRWWSAVVALLIATATTTVVASPVAAATTLELEAGWNGSYHPGEEIPVRVRVTADRLLRGELEVVLGDGGMGATPSVVRPVEVPGGNAKEFLFVVPSGIEQPGEVRAVLRGAAGVVAEGTARVEPAGDTELVGLLPGALAGRSVPDTAPLAIDAGTATFSEVDAAVLASPGALASLDVLGAAAGELTGLGGAGTDAVLAWVTAGGHLLVDDGRGVEVAGLPDAWQPGADGRSRAGLGEVVSVDGALAAGRFAGLVEPTPVERSGSGQFSSGEPIDATLARDAGLRLPQLGWLVGFLAAYVLLAVPVTLTVLRRRGRGELGWVALPLVALAFTGGGYLAGRDLRSGTTTAHATVVTSSDVGAVATTSIGVVSIGGGTVATTFPATWAVAASASSWSGPRTPVVAAQTNDGIELRQRLQPGEFGIRSATGPVDLGGALDVTATSDGNSRISGTIRSSLPFDLEEVAVFQGQSGVLVGVVPAGGETAWELDVTGGEDPFSGGARSTWRGASGMDRAPDPTSIVAFPLWERFDATSPGGYRSAGSVAVAGWTRAFTPPAGIGAGDLEGRTLVVTTGAVAAAPGPLSDVSVRTEKIRSPITSMGQGGGAFEDRAAFVFRYTLPSALGLAVDTAALVVRTTVPGVALEVWRDGAWLAVEPGTEPQDQGGARGDPNGTIAVGGAGGLLGPPLDHRLPAGAARDGVLWIRATGGQDPFLMDGFDSVTLRQAAP